MKLAAGGKTRAVSAVSTANIVVAGDRIGTSAGSDNSVIETF